MYEESGHSVAYYMVMGLLLLTLCTMVGLWYGGLARVKRLFSGKRRGTYKRVGDEDLEK